MKYSFCEKILIVNHDWYILAANIDASDCILVAAKDQQVSRKLYRLLWNPVDGLSRSRKMLMRK